MLFVQLHTQYIARTNLISQTCTHNAQHHSIKIYFYYKHSNMVYNKDKYTDWLLIATLTFIKLASNTYLFTENTMLTHWGILPLYYSISDWLITWHLVAQSESMFWIHSHSNNVSDWLKMNTSSVLTNQPIVLRGLQLIMIIIIKTQMV